ncbi:adenine phosphoribosyltransferase [Erythrobacter litoralis]|uniref:adenine phosphoribosyltransferase n=1 Tax=Erythrobacter litoralis TaxID=39960 RepID=UPI002434F113|nr:adenine phosphoribosyltransferase [Erythrobacter litoralis]MDG6080045.1 adenine phosphoribosyltransferase [Erythrobacter litoralis]
MTPAELKALVRTIPDFPAKGVQFRDITTLIGDGEGFASTVAWLAERIPAETTAIAGMEARGFIFGAAVAAQLSLPFLPIRKPGKLPCKTIGIDYHLEYGTDRLEMDPDAVGEGASVAIVDDLLATGGTSCAAAALLRKAGARVDIACFVIDLPDLGGRAKLREIDVAVDALMEFAGE